MVSEDEDALICDLAETYHIYDHRSLSPRVAATCACGLKEDSRIKMRLRGDKLTFEQMLLVRIFDSLNWLQWSKTRDGSKNLNRPESLFMKLTKADEREDCTSFDSGESYEAARERILKGG